MQQAKPALRLYRGKTQEPPADWPEEPGSSPTVEQIFRRYSGYVAVVAFRMLGRDDQIDDVVQDVFMVALKDLERLRDPAAVKGWLATITVRFAGRRLRMRRLRLLLGLDKAPRYQEVVAPAARLEARVLLGQIYAFLDELPVKPRLAWILRNIHGEPLDEVARLCGCSLSAAKRRIDAADQALQRMLSDE